MKPSIEREIEAVRQLIRDLETRLKNERVELGHRAVFDVGRRGEVPPPTRDDVDSQRVLSAGQRWITVATGSGGGGAGTPDGHTLAVVTGVLNAEPLSGTIDARFADLSGTIDGHFNALTYLTGVAHDSTLTGSGTAADPLSASPLSGTINARIVNLSGTIDGHFNVLSGTIDSRLTNVSSSVNVLSGSVDGHFNALSGTINSAFSAFFSGSQVWSQTANGTEGTTLTAVLPMPYPNTSYYAFITSTSGTTSPVYRVTNKSSSSFQVVSTAPFVNAARIDFLTITGGLGPVWDGSVLANLSQSIDAHFVTLSGTVNARFGTFLAPATASIAMSQSAQLATVNLSVTGTIDWFGALGQSRPSTLTPGSGLQAKKTGGWICSSFEWVLGGKTGVTMTSFTAPPTITTTGDSIGTPLTADNTARGFLITSTTTDTGFGFKLRAPALTTPRTLTLYTAQFSLDGTMTARLMDGSGLVVSGSFSVASNASARRTWTIVYNSQAPCDLVVDYVCSVNNILPSAVSCNVGFIGATLSGNF